MAGRRVGFMDSFSDADRCIASLVVIQRPVWRCGGVAVTVKRWTLLLFVGAAAGLVVGIWSCSTVGGDDSPVAGNAPEGSARSGLVALGAC